MFGRNQNYPEPEAWLLIYFSSGIYANLLSCVTWMCWKFVAFWWWQLKIAILRNRRKKGDLKGRETYPKKHIEISDFGSYSTYQVVATQIFLEFSPLNFREDFRFDEHIFHMCWFNHQLGWFFQVI